MFLQLNGQLPRRIEMSNQQPATEPDLNIEYEIAKNIVNNLVDEKLIKPQQIEKLIEKISIGSMSLDDWSLLLELSEQEKNTEAPDAE